MSTKFNISDVMISYSRHDKPFVQKLEAAISKTGRETWVDWDDISPTVDWWEEIKAGIEAAHIFLFIISPASIESQVCSDEISHAVANNKRIVPVVYQEIIDPALKAKMHPALLVHNWIMFRGEDNSKQAFRTLVKALEADLEHTKEHTRLLVRASEWNEKKRPRYLQLRGDDVKQADKWLEAAYSNDPKPIELQIDYISASRREATMGRVRSIGLAVVVVLIILVFGIALFAVQQSVIAKDNERIAQEYLTEVVAALGNLETADSQITIAANSQATADTARDIAQTDVAFAAEVQATLAVNLTQAAIGQATAEAGRVTAESELEVQRLDSDVQGTEVMDGQSQVNRYNDALAIVVTYAPDSVQTEVAQDLVNPQPDVPQSSQDVPASATLYEFVDESIQFRSHDMQACSWQGLAGSVLDTDGTPHSESLIVHVSGASLSQPLSAATGSNRQHGASGFEIPLGNRASATSYIVQLISLEGVAVSNPIPLTFSGSCDGNLAIVTFVEVEDE